MLGIGKDKGKGDPARKNKGITRMSANSVNVSQPVILRERSDRRISKLEIIRGAQNDQMRILQRS
jgi:hypothetical protein